MELSALAKVHAELSNAHRRRTMYSNQQNIIKTVHVEKIKGIDNIHLY
jgi:hypothetical protein